MVKNPPANAGDTGSSPGQGTKILQAVQHRQKNKTTTTRKQPKKGLSKSSDITGVNTYARSDSQLPTWCPDGGTREMLPWALGCWREVTSADCWLHHYPRPSS